MKKTIILFGLCFIALSLCSKLDAFFAIAIACEKDGYPSQSAYKYSYGPEIGLSELQKAQVGIRQDLTETGIRDERSWDVIVRDSSKITGDFTIAHGFFAIVHGIAINASEPDVCLSIIGVGVSRKDPLIAINNARKDFEETIKNINSCGLIGAFEVSSADLFDFGQF